MTKPTRELNETIETEEDGAGAWTARLPVLGIEVKASTRDEAQQLALSALMETLNAMPGDDGKRWFENHTTVLPEGTEPACFVSKRAWSQTRRGEK